jgi:outer membrane protein OmpA-like peptidoglycan-associated protein
MNFSTRDDLDKFMVSNIRYAVGAADTRSKLLTEGKLVTRGILFDSNSDVIQPGSFGVLKDIASVLNDNPTLRIQIIGHTDSDGEPAANLLLSQKRAAAVKKALSEEFKVDSGMMETDGKGESEPTEPNTTTAGKANNRRVEFIKL